MSGQSPYFLATGRVCHQWSYLEYLFSQAIWHLLGIDKETGMIVTGGMDILPRAAMAINLCRHQKAVPELELALVAARKAVQGGLQDERNKVVHGVYSSNENAAFPTIETHRGKGDRKRHPITSEEIEALSSRIFDVSKGLIAVFEPLGISCD